MAVMMRADVLDLPDAGFEALAACFADAGLVCDGAVGQDGLDVGAENDGSAGEVAQAEDGLDLILRGKALARKLDWGRERFVPSGSIMSAAYP